MSSCSEFCCVMFYDWLQHCKTCKFRCQFAKPSEKFLYLLVIHKRIHHMDFSGGRNLNIAVMLSILRCFAFGFCCCCLSESTKEPAMQLASQEFNPKFRLSCIQLCLQTELDVRCSAAGWAVFISQTFTVHTTHAQHLVKYWLPLVHFLSKPCFRKAAHFFLLLCILLWPNIF